MAVPGFPEMKRTIKIFFTPATDTGLQIGRNVGRDDVTEGCRHDASARIRLTTPRRMTGHAVACARKIGTAAVLCSGVRCVRKCRRGIDVAHPIGDDDPCRQHKQARRGKP